MGLNWVGGNLCPQQRADFDNDLFLMRTTIVYYITPTFFSQRGGGALQMLSRFLGL